MKLTWQIDFLQDEDLSNERQKTVPLKNSLKLERILQFQKRPKLLESKKSNRILHHAGGRKFDSFFSTHSPAFDNFFQFEV